MSEKWKIDVVLLQRWRDGDKVAGDQLFARHADAVIRFFRNKVSVDPEDLVQRTFLALIEGSERIRDGEALRGYILGIAKNVLREWLRRNKAEVDFEVESIASVVPGPSAIVARRQEHRLLAEALRHLPIHHQTALELSYWEGLKATEIAVIMGVSHSAMRSRLVKAKSLLVTKIAELSESAKLVESTVSGLDNWADQLRRQLGNEDDESI